MYTIKPIKAFNDNYIWCIHNKYHAIVVDPGIADPVIDYLNINGLNLCAILITHHHKDHTGGVDHLKKLYTNLDVYSSIENIATQIQKEGNVIKIHQLDNIEFNVIETPGHTLDHIAFYGNGWLFCGDTLFSAGCGRIFEGTYQQMYNSLMKIRNLESSTLIYTAHEYTIKNIEFALTLEPHNNDLLNRYNECLNLISHNIPTVPTTLKTERQINPFLRCDIMNLPQYPYLKNINPVELFAYIRNLRNNF